MPTHKSAEKRIKTAEKAGPALDPKLGPKPPKSNKAGKAKLASKAAKASKTK